MDWGVRLGCAHAVPPALGAAPPSPCPRTASYRINSSCSQERMLVIACWHDLSSCSFWESLMSCQPCTGMSLAVLICIFWLDDHRTDATAVDLPAAADGVSSKRARTRAEKNAGRRLSASPMQPGLAVQVSAHGHAAAASQDGTHRMHCPATSCHMIASVMSRRLNRRCSTPTGARTCCRSRQERSRAPSPRRRT